MAYPTYNKPQISSAPTYRGGAFRGMPTYSAPGWNEGEVTSLAQRRAAPGLRALRGQLKRVTGGGEGATRRLSLRDALAGYGQGVGSVIGSAGTSAANEYGDKYSALSSGSLSEYRSRAEAARAFNERGQDIAKTNYGGEMAEWGARNTIESRASDMDYASRVRGWEAETDLEKTKYLTGAQTERDKRMFEFGEEGKQSDYKRLKAEREAANRAQVERDQILFDLSERAKRGDVEAQKQRDQMLFEFSEKSRAGTARTEAERDQRLYEMDEQRTLGDFRRRIEEAEYASGKQSARDLSLWQLGEQSKTADFGRQSEARRSEYGAQAERDQRLYELGERGKTADYGRLVSEREAADRTQSERDQRLYGLSEQGKKSDYKRWLEEQEYGEGAYQRRRQESESQRKIDYAWKRWMASNPINPTNPMGNYQYLSNTGTGR